MLVRTSYEVADGLRQVYIAKFHSWTRKCLQAVLHYRTEKLGGHEKAQTCQPSFRGQQGQPQHAGFKISRCGRISVFHPARVSRGESHKSRFLQLITPICEGLVFRALLLKLFSSSSRQRELFLCAARFAATVSVVGPCKRELRVTGSRNSNPTLGVAANVWQVEHLLRNG